MFPRDVIYLMMVIPVPMWLGVGGFVLYDVYRSLAQGGGVVDTAAHVGGAAAGLAWYFLRIRGRF
jgi:membrane associated rhomboid family serine protease